MMPPSTATQIVQSGYLPPPGTDAQFILEIEKALRSMARSAKSRETICNYVQEHKYIYSMLEAFETAEKNELLDVLHALCSCMQTIGKSYHSRCRVVAQTASVVMNEHTMYEHILIDDLWMGVVGILECES